MNYTPQIDKAIGSHGMWKSRLRRAIETGQSEFSIDTVKADNQCEFGKWLQSLPSTASPDVVRSIRALHTKFHGHAALVLDHALAGRKSEAEKAIALGSEFSATSSALVKALMDWKKQQVDA